MEDNHIIKSQEQPNNLKQLSIKAKSEEQEQKMSQQCLYVADQTVAFATL